MIEETSVADRSEAEPRPGLLLDVTLIVAGFAVSGVALPHAFSADAAMRFQALSQLAHNHTLSNMRYSMIGPVFAMPMYLMGAVVRTPEFWVLRFNLVVLAAGLLALYLLLRRYLDSRVLRTFLLLLVTASMFTRAVLDFDGEVFTAMLVGVGIVAILAGPALLGWVGLVLGVANVPATAVGLAIITAHRLVTSRRLRYLIPLAATAALILGEAWLRRGSPFNTGYANDKGYRTVMPYSGLPGFSYPLFFGFLSIFLSFGKGLIFYTPGLFLPVRRILRELATGSTGLLESIWRNWLWFIAGLVLVYSSWWAWYGGFYWGPRFFLVASIPACFALALWIHRPGAALWANLITILVLLLSIWVGIDGAVFQQRGLRPVCAANHYALESLCQYTPDFSALWHPFVAMPGLDAGQIWYTAYSIVVLLYLMSPVAVRTGRQIAKHWAKTDFTWLRPRAWRF